MAAPLDRLRVALERHGLAQAVLSHAETLANLVGYAIPVEDWPLANPFAPDPALLVVTPADAVLVVADFYLGHARDTPARVLAYRSYDYERSPDPSDELERPLAGIELAARPTAVEAGSLPLRIAEWLTTRGLELVDAESTIEEARPRKGPAELEAIRSACRLADAVQQAVKDEARPGLTEAELAGLAQAAMYRAAGRRVPAILTVTSGPATATGGGEATDRALAEGDLVLTDTSPWL